MKGIVLSKRNNSYDALSAYDQALAYLGGTSENWISNFIMAGMIFCKGMTFMQNSQPEEALAAFDQVVALDGKSKGTHFAGTTANALAAKVIALDEMDQTISETEFSLLLKSLQKWGQLSNRTIDAIVCFIIRVEPARAIELIQASPAAQGLLPIVTALKQELGQTTHVAKEIDEVAADIRRIFVELRGRRKQPGQV